MTEGNYWANYNGPGKPITQQQLHQILAEQFGIEPVLLSNGEWGYSREQFKEAWRLFTEGNGSFPQRASTEEN